MNVAFFEEESGHLVEYDHFKMTHKEITSVACLLTSAYEHGIELPGRYFVVWHDKGPKQYLGVFVLDTTVHVVPNELLDLMEKRAHELHKTLCTLKRDNTRLHSLHSMPGGQRS